jgi:hypothetical protein
LFEEVKTTFANYRIPPAFFGPFKLVSYEGIGGSVMDNPDDAEFILNVGKEFRPPITRKEYELRKIKKEELEKEVP